MINFNEWKILNEEESKIPQNLNQAPILTPKDVKALKPLSVTPKIKPWKAGKEEITKYWKALAGNLPLALKPIPYDHEGTTIQEDGIRITGSKEFITSVLSRLKDFLTFENPNDKLVVSYRQSPKSFVKGNKNSYSFYLQVKERGKRN
jgi:hypothetical protein